MQYSLRAIFVVMTVGAVLSCYAGIAYRQSQLAKLPKYQWQRPKWLPESVEHLTQLVQHERRLFLERAAKSGLPEVAVYLKEASRQDKLIREFVEVGFDGGPSNYHSERPDWLPKSLDVWQAERVRSFAILHMEWRRNSTTEKSQLSTESRLPAIANFPNVEVAWVDEANDLSPLAGMRKLKVLGIDAKQIGDLKPLANLINLEELSLCGVNHSELSPLKGLKRLTRLLLVGEGISHVDDLSSLVNLEEFYCFNKDLRDIAGLSTLVNLKHLELYGNGLRDVSALKNLTRLKELTLAFGSLPDLSPLSGAENLTTLTLSGSDVRDLSPLVNLQHLNSLSISGTPISDVSAIAQFKSLRTLKFEGTAVSPEDVGRLRQLLPHCSIHYSFYMARITAVERRANSFIVPVPMHPYPAR